MEGAPRLGDRLRLPGDPVILLALLLAFTGVVAAWQLGRRSPGLDFYQFWVVAQVAGRPDVPNVYDAEARARVGAEFVRRSLTDEDSERRRVAARPWQVLEPTATPLFYSAFRPLAGGSYETAHALFGLLSLAAVTAGVLGLARLVGHRPAVGLLLLAFVTHAFQPLKADIRVGNVNQLQLGLLALYLWLSGHGDRSRLQPAAGALLAALVLFKPNLFPALLLLPAGWAFGRRRAKLARQVPGMALGAAAGLALGATTFGTLRAWPDWWAYLASLPPAKIPLRYGNLGLARLLLESLGVDLAPLLAAAATGVALACLWVGRRGEAAPAATPTGATADGATLAAACLVYLLAAPIVWLHYLLLALPAALVLLRPAGGARASWRHGLALLALAALAVDPVAEVFGVRELRHQAVMTALGLLLLFALVCREIARAEPAPAGAAAAGSAAS